MQIIRTARFLRTVLFADAAISTATGILLTLLTAKLSELLALPVGLLFYAGLSLFPFAAFFLYVATRKKVAALFVWVIVIGNLLWTMDSLLLLFTGWVAPNAGGVLFVVAQALAVAVLAGLEFVGLKRSEIDTDTAFQPS